MDKNTFGGTKAAEILVDRLSHQEVKVASKIAKLLTTFSTSLNELKKINSKVALYFAGFAYKASLQSCENLPLGVRTYTTNVVKTKYKTFLTEMDGRKAYLRRKDHPNNVK